MLPLVEIDHVDTTVPLISWAPISAKCPFLAIFAQNLALHNKNDRVLLSQALCVLGSLGNLMFNLHISPTSNYVLGLIFVMNYPILQNVPPNKEEHNILYAIMWEYCVPITSHTHHPQPTLHELSVKCG